MRSELEKRVKKFHPSWEETDRNIIIPYESRYSPDFWTGRNFVEIKGQFDPLDQAKMKKVSDYLCKQNNVEVRLPDTMTELQKSLIEDSIKHLESLCNGMGFRLDRLVKPTFSQVVLCPVVPENKIDLPIPTKRKTGVLTGLDTVKWCIENQIPVQPFSEQRLGMLSDL